MVVCPRCSTMFCTLAAYGIGNTIHSCGGLIGVLLPSSCQSHICTTKWDHQTQNNNNINIHVGTFSFQCFFRVCFLPQWLLHQVAESCLLLLRLCSLFCFPNLNCVSSPNNCIWLENTSLQKIKNTNTSDSSHNRSILMPQHLQDMKMIRVHRAEFKDTRKIKVKSGAAG